MDNYYLAFPLCLLTNRTETHAQRHSAVLLDARGGTSRQSSGGQENAAPWMTSLVLRLYLP